MLVDRGFAEPFDGPQRALHVAALAASAAVAADIRTAFRLGLGAADPKTSMKAVRERALKVAAARAPLDSHERLAALGIEVVTGETRFVDAATLAVGDRQIRPQAIILAVGGDPAIPAIQGLEEASYFTPESILDSPRKLTHLLVIGANQPRGRFGLQPVAELAPVQRVGDWSYAIYLWHWPLLILVPLALGGTALSPIGKLGILVATFVLAWLTREFVEVPFIRLGRTSAGRTAPRRLERRTLLAAAAGMLAAAQGMQAHTEDRAGGERADRNAVLRGLRRADHLDGPDDRLAVLAADDAFALFVHRREEDLQMVRVGIHPRDDSREHERLLGVVNRERVMS